MPDTPATVLDIEPEPDEYALSFERMTPEEIRLVARPIGMPPLHTDEMPDSAVSVFAAEPDPRLDEPSWGLYARAPEITVKNGKMLHPWDDDPAETN